MKRFKHFIVVLWVIASPATAEKNLCNTNHFFNIGSGIYDITGPAAEEGMMGYGMIKQQTKGIYNRLWSRAFIIESSCNGKRVVIVNVDLGHVFQGIKQGVIKSLKTKYGDIYNDSNVLITATHQHSGPGGYSSDTFYNLTTLGFSKGNYTAIVNGIVASIERATKNIKTATIRYAEKELNGLTTNRSPQAYQLNPEKERAQYHTNTDNTFNLLRFDDIDHTPFAMINWFGVHGVSMNNKNHLINGDNKGYAAYLFEKDFNSHYETADFVAAFAQGIAGDVSPNALGQEGGAGDSGIAAVEKAGFQQYLTAKELFDHPTETITGSVDYRHVYLKMDDITVAGIYTDGKPHKTCTAALGVSMFAGTQDGEGVGRQGVTCDTVKQAIPHFICEKSRTACQGVKPIALSTGSMFPHPWTPNILPLQLIKIGHVVIVGTPFELTTMTGRRLKAALQKIFTVDDHIIIATLTNAYAGYIATQEEYQGQYYEGASTHFGPWTESALRQEMVKLAQDLISGRVNDQGPIPPDLLANQINLQPGVWFDLPPHHQHFGDVAKAVNRHYRIGDIVEAQFWGGHPKNNYRLQNTFLMVQHLNNGEWQTVRLDRDWDTEYHWQRVSVASSLITIRWRTNASVAPGTYRLVHLGNAKSFWGSIKPYKGVSNPFEII